MSIIPALYERLTGKPWTTGRSASVDYGPPPGAVYAEQLAVYSDAELVAHDLTDLLRRPQDLRRHLPAGGAR
jgi:hypothetical protein